MSEQAVLTREGEGISATLQERVRAFTAFYEQHAYLAYNLALRIACDGAAAERATQRAFLGQIEDEPPGLLPAAIRTAVEEAPRDPDPDAAAAGDAESQALLAAAVRLPAAERAALAASDLADAGPEEIGGALGIPADQAANLLERGRAAFAEALGVPREQGDAAARDWMWAAPPQEIWEALYPRFHRTVERRLRAGEAEQTLVLKRAAAGAPAAPTRAGRRRLRTASRPAAPRWLRRTPLSVVLPAAALLLVAAGIAATQLPRESGDEPEAPFATGDTGFAPAGGAASGESATSESGVKPRKRLTAELLDKLRLRELRQLRAYTKRQANRSLPARQRRAAARRIAALERAARARLRAQQRREAMIREREARARARSQAPPPPPPPPPARTERRASSPSSERRQQEPSQPAGTPRTREEAERNCLQDESTGQFVCPQ